MKRIWLVWAVVLIASGTFCRADDENKDRTPEPTTQAVADAEKLVKDVYHDDFARHTPEDRRALGLKLLDEGRATTGDPASHYVLFCESRDAAISVGDVDTAMAAATEIGKCFAVNAVDLKYKTLQSLRSSTHTEDTELAAAQAALDLVNEAASADSFDMAGKAAEMAMTFASAAKNPSLVAQAQLLRTDVKAQSACFMEMKFATETLAKDPNDTDAKFSIGSYIAMYKGDWEGALPMLAAGSNSAWSAAAKADLAGPVDVGEMTKVADMWWDLAAAKPAQRAHVLVRAEFWYNLVVPNADGLLKAKAQKRLDEITNGRPMAVGALNAVSDATRRILPTPEELARLRQLEAAVHNGNFTKQQDLTQLRQELMMRLEQDCTAGSDADFFARCHAEMLVRKIMMDAKNQGQHFVGVIQQFPAFAESAKSKDEFAARLLALERYNGQDEALTQTNLDNMVFRSIQNYTFHNVSLFPTMQERLALCAMLKAKGLRSAGLDRYQLLIGAGRN